MVKKNKAQVIMGYPFNPLLDKLGISADTFQKLLPMVALARENCRKFMVDEGIDLGYLFYEKTHFWLKSRRISNVYTYSDKILVGTTDSRRSFGKIPLSNMEVTYPSEYSVGLCNYIDRDDFDVVRDIMTVVQEKVKELATDVEQTKKL